MSKFCSNCGKEINENADVCLNCGRFIKDNNNKELTNKSKDESWKGFCTFVGIAILIIYIAALLFDSYNCRAYEENCNLAHTLGFDYGFGYALGRNIFLIIAIIFLYLENKKINNIIRLIFITIIIVAILIICGY